jgi:hypothetical protein
VAPFRPPFSYNFVCFSNILTAYIPVYLLTYCLKIIVPALMSYVLATFVSYEKLPEPVRSRVRGALWPSYWPRRREGMVSSSLMSSTTSTHLSPLSEPSTLEDQVFRESQCTSHSRVTFGFRSRSLNSVQSGPISDRVEEREMATPELLYKPARVFGSITQDLCVFFTFGLCSPVLALAVGLYSTISILQTRIMISRFVSLRCQPSPYHEDEDHALIVLETSLLGMAQEFKEMVWPIVWASCFFVTFLCWEISGDSTSWEKSLWVPVTSIVLATTIYLMRSYMVRTNWWSNNRPGDSYLYLIDRMFPSEERGETLRPSRPSNRVSSLVEMKSSFSISPVRSLEALVMNGREDREVDQS